MEIWVQGSKPHLDRTFVRQITFNQIVSVKWVSGLTSFPEMVQTLLSGCKKCRFRAKPLLGQIAFDEMTYNIFQIDQHFSIAFSRPGYFSFLSYLVARDFVNTLLIKNLPLP